MKVKLHVHVYSLLLDINLNSHLKYELWHENDENLLFAVLEVHLDIFQNDFKIFARCLVSYITEKITLAILCGCIAWFVLNLLGNPEDWFSQEAHINCMFR